MPFITNANAPDGLPVVPLWINGESQPIDKDALFPVTSSLQNKPVHYAMSASPTAATAACNAAASSLISWRKTSPTHRRALLLKTADIVDRRAQDIMDAQMVETSCAKDFASFNVVKGAEYMREIAAATGELRGTVPQGTTGKDGEESSGLTVVIREPVGVVLIIPP
jgi:acyl-CoA reductase-like NAD-dependent aldehyde dehydrogenase